MIEITVPGLTTGTDFIILWQYEKYEKYEMEGRHGRR